ncbi:MAG TPA: ATP-binding protein [Tepidisphaeraceae bacterium]|nr:ATP-binding protein [Tepidisphaeraceae bacterium]
MPTARSFWHFRFSSSQTQSLTIGIALLAIVGCLDWITGPNLDFSLFYLIPVCVVTWYGGQRSGFIASAVCAGTWLCVDRETGAKQSTPLLVSWNLVMRLAFFAVSVMLIEGWKNAGKKLAWMVEERTAALRRLAAQLSAAEDAERRRLAYDMHDALSQTLSLIKIHLDEAQIQCSDRTPAQIHLMECGTLVESVIKQTRTLMFDLYPAMLDDLGLVPTLQWYAREFKQRVGTEIIISEHGERTTLTTILTNYLFRAVKELLTNAVQHGHAKEIILTVHWEIGMLRLVVDDDGTGFDVTAARVPDSRRGLGLAGITERISSMGGRMEMESHQGQGSRIIVEVPLPTEPHLESNHAFTSHAC